MMLRRPGGSPREEFNAPRAHWKKRPAARKKNAAPRSGELVGPSECSASLIATRRAGSRPHGVSFSFRVLARRSTARIG
jgi:hypothetical protein